uniref:Uncharacterized protein n=1 Tax=Arundo donax TaxID=35708 RepID=A0A0A8XX73_ARUDO
MPRKAAPETNSYGNITNIGKF